MKKNRIRNGLFIFLITIISFGFINVSVVSASRNDIMEVDKIKVGMKGICKTVFNGYKVENFDVEVIGIMENVFPRKNIILVKCSGDRIKESGIAAGMSGSPVYIDGKLVGALAYSWGFPKEAIAGVTPITDMLNVIHGSGDENPKVNSSGILLKPLSGLLLVSGMDKLLLEELKKEMGKLEFMVQPIAGHGISGVAEKNPPKVEPGSAVGVSMVSGDLNVSAIGTLTFIDGKNIFAFGHRMLNLGDTELPLTSAYIYGIFPSYEQSFKMGTTLEQIGKIIFDKESGIAGEIGSFAKLIPLKVVLSDEGSKNPVTYNFSVINNKLLSSKLISIVVANSVASFSKSIGENTIEVSMNVKIASYPALKYKDMYYSPISPQMVVLQSLLPVLEMLANNDFSEIEFEKVETEISLSNARKVAEIQEVFLSRSKVKPGETVNLNVILRKFGFSSEKITIPVEIPFDTPPGNISVIVCDAATSDMIDSARVPREMGPGGISMQNMFFLKAKPVSLKHLIELMEKQEKNTNIIVKLFMPFRKGAYADGEEISSLPYTMFQIIKTSTNTKYKEMFDSIYTKIYNTDWVITGSQRVNIMVDTE